MRRIISTEDKSKTELNLKAENTKLEYGNATIKL
jgi:hypothetical protein